LSSSRRRRLLRRLRLELNGYRRGAVRVTPQSLARRTALQRLRGALINLAAPYL
jgi:hypothetical protein